MKLFHYCAKNLWPFLLGAMVSQTSFGAKVISGHKISETFTAIDKSLPTPKMFLTEENDFIPIKSRIDQKNNKFSRYIQSYQGIPIWGHHLIVKETPNNEISYSGFFVSGLAQDFQGQELSYKLDREQALAIAKKSMAPNFAASQYEYSGESSQLVIYLMKDNNPNLAYAVNFFADTDKGNPTRPYFIIDANSGSVIEQWEGLTFSKIGEGPGGNEKAGKRFYGDDFPLLEVTEKDDNTCIFENEKVRTVDLNHSSRNGKTHKYQCPENTYKAINGAYSPLNDAHYFGGVVFEMFESWLEMPPLTFQLELRVHYSRNYENAFWNGSSMTFGDGRSRFYPLVSLDVMAHEVSHGFTEQNSGLIYSRQSGGINEAFSDISGEAAEYFSTGENDWNVGAEIFKQANKALRYLHNPTADGRSIDHADDFTQSMNVHYSSGVYNKAFHILATSPTWDTKKAFLVFAKANMDYWSPSTDFNDGACGVRSAAADLDFNIEDVEEAFKKVGVACGAEEA